VNARRLLPLLLVLGLEACSCSDRDLHPGPGDGGTGGAGGEGGAAGSPPPCGTLTEVEGRACSAAGCWIFPEPAPLDVRAGGFDSKGRLWIGGVGSSPLIRDGSKWRAPLDGLPAVTATAAFGFREGEVWALHGGLLLRLAGERWEEVDRGPFPFSPTALWVTPRAVWIAGPEVRRNEGTGWQSLPAIGYGPFGALWGMGEVVFAAGADGLVFRWREGEWQHLPSPARRGLRSIWGASLEDVWFGGDGGTLLRLLGDTFHAYDVRSGASIISIAGNGPNDVLALGFDATVRKAVLFHFDGRFWQPLPVPEGVDPWRLWTSPDGVWIAGRGGGMALWTGACFRVSGGEPRRILAIEDDRWAVGERGLVVLLGEDGAEVVDAGVDADLRAAAIHDGEVWIAGDDGTLLRGGEQGFRPVPIGGSQDLLALHGSAKGMWVGADDGSIFLADDRSVVQTPSATVWPVDSIVAFGDEAWAGTQGGELLRWDGAQWRYERSVFGRPHLFGTGPDDLWLLGRQGAEAVLEHRVGEDWRIVPQGTPTTVHAIASNGNEIWVGHAPYVLHHFDGRTWTARYLGWRVQALAHDGKDLWILTERRLLRWRDDRIEAVHTSPVTMTALSAQDDEVWVGAADGSIGRLAEEGLVFDAPLAEGPIRAIHGAGGDLWAISEEGFLLRRDETGWRAEKAPVEVQFRALWAEGDSVWIGTSEGLLVRDDDGWRSKWSPVSDIAALWVDGSGRLVVAGTEGGVHVLGDGELAFTLHPSLVVRVLHGTTDGALWIGGVPAEDGAHLYRFDGENLQRFDLGVTAPMDAGAAWAPGEALVARGDSLLVVAPDGTTRALGRAPWAIGSFSRRRDGPPALAAGSAGGILRLQNTEPAP